MRLASISLLVLLELSCSRPQPDRSIDRIELSQGGTWSGIVVKVNKKGAGTYDRTGTRDKASGSFTITPEQFQQLRERLEPFRHDATPYSAENGIAFLTRACPKGLPFTTDQGVFWVRWVGRTVDQLYFADLGCDADRNANRNTELLNVVSSLPVPHG